MEPERSAGLPCAPPVDRGLGDVMGLNTCVVRAILCMGVWSGHVAGFPSPPAGGKCVASCPLNSLH